jgi:hypothetical protein
MSLTNYQFMIMRSVLLIILDGITECIEVGENGNMQAIISTSNHMKTDL